MKICFFANARNVHVQRIAPALAARGHQVHLICHKPVDIPGVTVERYSVPGPGLTNPRRWRGRWAHYLRGIMRGFDVVVVYFLHDWGLTPEIIETGCLVASPRGSDIVPPPGEAPPSDALTAKRVALLRNAAGVGVGGAAFGRIVSDFACIEADRIDLLPLGVDLNLFSPPPRTASKSDGGYRVGFFKGFRPVYGCTYLLRSIPTVVEELPEARFDLIGDGPQLAECKRLSGLYGVELAINWVRRQPHRNIPQYLAGWDLTVMPSVCESFGLAALESSAMGVPVVASHVGGLTETVRDGVTGVLVEPKSPEQFADAIIGLLRDGERRTRMGKEGRALVEREYEWGAVLDQWESTLTKALDRTCIMV